MLYRKTFVAVLAGLFGMANSLFAQVLMPSKEASQNILSLDGTWKFHYFPSSKTGADSSFYRPDFDAKSWSDIKVPGNWELQGFAEPFYGNKLKDGTGLYRTSFTVPAGWRNNPVYIAFDGVSNGYTVWLNGRYVGEFASAFNRQTFDISPFIVAGQANLLAVKVMTHPKGYEFDTNDDWSLSGIFRDVTVFSLSPVHLQDVVIKTFVRAGSASLDIQAAVEKTAQSSFPVGLNFTGQLLDASGTLVKEFALTSNKAVADPGTIRFSQRFDLPKPNLWSAETPYLYTLRLVLKNNTALLQQYTEKVGIREVTWAGGILKMNGSPIKLKGVNHHDLSPVNGRSISDAEIMKDLVLMQQGNINFIRTCHYPPQPRLLELCDSLGIYVMDEVPYGYGDELLKDTSYLPLLLLRAKATLWRDKNRPCVIAWSVGNENPVTPIGLTTGRYVKRMDATRPYCFPQTPGVIRDMLKAMPDSLDMLDFHYPKVPELRKLANEIDRPLIASEYTHALGLDFGKFEESYEIMYESPKLAGGAVWGFFDQGILRKTTDRTAKGQPTIYAWASKDSIYDTGGNQGTDGILYADRTPQVDYFTVRKVYSPVKALDDTFTYKPGKNALQVKLVNRYDFIDLSTLQCRWQLLADNEVLSTGFLPLTGKPHDTLTATIAIILPPQPVASYYYLKLFFTDKKKYQLYEKTYLIQPTKSNPVLMGLVAGMSAKPVKTGEAVVANNYRFQFAKDSGNMVLTNKAGEVLIAKGPFARVGKKPSMAQDATTSSSRSKVLHTIWNPFLLTRP